MPAFFDREFFFKKGYSFLPQIKLDQSIKNETVGIINRESFTGLSPIRYSCDVYPSSFLKIDQPHFASSHLKKLVQDNIIGQAIAGAFKAETVQLWSTALYSLNSSDNKSFVGVHSDSKYTDFIIGDYCSLFIAMSDIDIVVLDNIGMDEDIIDDKYNNPIVDDIDKQIDQMDILTKRLTLKEGDRVLFHSSCLKGIIPSKGEAKILVAYYRTENNFFRKNKMSFGMIDHVDNFILSPILFHKVNYDE